jgi:DNA repair exonuclease SbcCD ATPase subunit
MCDCYREYGIYEAERDIGELQSNLRHLEKALTEFLPEEEYTPNLYSILLEEQEEYRQQNKDFWEKFPQYAGDVSSVGLDIWDIIEGLLSTVKELKQEVNYLKDQLNKQ